jgi:hypothetical protein
VGGWNGKEAIAAIEIFEFTNGTLNNVTHDY